MIHRFRRPGLVAAVGLGLLYAVPLTAAGQGAASQLAPATTVPLRIIATNDFHGNLEPPTGSSGRVVVAGGGTVDAGGAAYLAAHLAQLRAQVTDSVFIGSGDLIGASPLLSALFHDEPTIELFKMLGMKLSAAGEHEFDEGYNELIRIQRGGCHPVDGCQFRPTYDGSGFPYLGANVTFRGTRIPALLPTWITYVQGIPIGYIGMPAKNTSEFVSAAGIKSISFGDEIAAANAYADVLDRLGVKTIVLMVHQGDPVAIGNTPDVCNIVPGVAQQIAQKVSPKIDVVFSARSHQQYNCTVTDPAGNPRPFIQGLSFGRILSVVDLQIDRKTRDVVRSKTVATNHVVTRDVIPNPAVQALIDEVVTKAAPLANRPVGTITSSIARVAAPSGETPLGNLIADAQLEQTQAAGAQIAFMNTGNLRGDLLYPSSPAGEGDGVVTYGEAFTVQPFGQAMTTLTFTGAQLKAVLEQQWQPTITRILQPSQSFTYSYSQSLPVGSKVSNMFVNGVPIDPAASYRVSINSFLAGGGDGFNAFTAGTNRTGGVIDLDAFTAYLMGHPNLAPPATNRITVMP
jgi:5'-nucleotidase